MIYDRRGGEVAQVTRKLYARQGEVLGTVTFPAEWDDHLKRQQGISFYANPKPWRPVFTDEAADSPVTFRTAHLSVHWPERDGVELHGIAPEEFERLPNCGFAAGAGYVFALLEGWHTRRVSES